MDASTVVSVLQERLPCRFDEVADGRWQVFLPGSDSRVAVDRAEGTLSVATPVPGAHDGLPADDLIDLLRFNMPNDLTRGAFLAVGRAAGRIDLVDTVPLGSLSPMAAAAAVLDQIAAALALAERLDKRRAARRR